MSGRKKEPFDVIDPLQQKAVEMVSELRQYSAHNQALALIKIRQKDPRLAVMLVRMLRTTLSPGTANEKDSRGNT